MCKRGARAKKGEARSYLRGTTEKGLAWSCFAIRAGCANSLEKLYGFVFVAQLCLVTWESGWRAKALNMVCEGFGLFMEFWGVFWLEFVFWLL